MQCLFAFASARQSYTSRKNASHCSHGVPETAQKAHNGLSRMECEIRGKLLREKRPTADTQQKTQQIILNQNKPWPVKSQFNLRIIRKYRQIEHCSSACSTCLECISLPIVFFSTGYFHRRCARLHIIAASEANANEATGQTRTFLFPRANDKRLEWI